MKTLLATEVVRSRISPELKQEAEGVFQEMGMSLSDGIRLFLRQVVVEKAIPFEIKVPNAVTRAAMKDARARTARFHNLEEMMHELEGQETTPKARKRAAGV